tara:strand:+ start:25 stop:354 length:330 start_codon:yes stop_codon:yes gene_type:complete
MKKVISRLLKKLFYKNSSKNSSKLSDDKTCREYSIRYMNINGEQYNTLPQSFEPIMENDWCFLFDDLGNLLTDYPQQFLPNKGHVLNNGLEKVIFTTDFTISHMVNKER